MTRRDVRLYLRDMIEACEEIAVTMAGLDEAGFMADRLRPKAVIRDLEVLGEACRNVPEELRALASGVPWRLIVAMRNHLAHEYFGVDLGIVFHAAADEVPVLLPHLRRVLARLDR